MVSEVLQVSPALMTNATVKGSIFGHLSPSAHFTFCPVQMETSGKILAIFPTHDQIATVFALRVQTNIDFDTAFLPWVNIRVILILPNKLKWVH